MRKIISKVTLKLIICILSVFILVGCSNSKNDIEGELIKEKDKFLKSEKSKIELETHKLYLL